MEFQPQQMTLITDAHPNKTRRNTLIRMSRDFGVKIRSAGQVQHNFGTLRQVALDCYKSPAYTDVQGRGKIDKLLAISIQPTDEYRNG